MKMFRIVVLCVLTVTLASARMLVAANAQGVMPGFKLNETREYTDDEKARMKANEDAAKAARSTLPNAKASSDPWAGARAAETPVKVTPKAVKPKAATQ